MPIPQLPFDVLSEILSHFYQSHKRPSTPSRASTPRKGSTSLLLVSKAFHELALPFVYQSISIGRSSEDWELFFAPNTGLLVGDQEGKTRRSWVKELRVHASMAVPPLELEEVETLLMEVGMRPEEVDGYLVELCGKVSFPNLRSVGLIPGTTVQQDRIDLVQLLRVYAEDQDFVISRDEDGNPCYCPECIFEYYEDIFDGIKAKQANFISQLLLPSLPALTTISLSISNCASPHVFEESFLQAFLNPSCHAILRLHHNIDLDHAKEERESAVAHLRGLHDALPFDAKVQLVGFRKKTRKMFRGAVEKRVGEGDLANWEFVSSSKVDAEAFLNEV